MPTILWLSAWGHVYEAAVVPLERDGDHRRRPVPVLGDDEVRLARPGRLRLVGVLPVQQDHNVTILLDRTTLAQVGKQWAFVIALLGASVQLGDRDHGDVKFLGEKLQG